MNTSESIKNSDALSVPKIAAGNTKAEPSSAFKLKMPGTASESAQDTAAVGGEGTPPDPRAGPGVLWRELVLVLLLLTGLSIAAGLWLGWAPGIVSFAISLIALLMNPVIGATIARAHDRRVVIDYRTHDGNPDSAKRTGEIKE